MIQLKYFNYVYLKAKWFGAYKCPPWTFLFKLWCWLYNFDFISYFSVKRNNNSIFVSIGLWRDFYVLPLLLFKIKCTLLFSLTPCVSYLCHNSASSNCLTSHSFSLFAIYYSWNHAPLSQCLWHCTGGGFGQRLTESLAFMDPKAILCSCHRKEHDLTE
jgi:hypothetical protein